MSDYHEQEECQFYVDKIGTSEIHSFFTQAVRSKKRGLFLGSSLCYVAGVEASIRGALARMNGLSFDDDYGATLSNRLLRDAHDCGLPVEALSMKHDVNFLEAIQRNKPIVKIVEIRHTLAHGNLVEFVNCEHSFFTVELLEDLSSELDALSKSWVLRLSESTSNPFK